MGGRWARLLVLSVVPLAGLVVVAIAEPWTAGAGAVVMILAGAILESFPVPLSPDVKSSLSAVGVLLGLLLGGLPLATSVALGIALAVVLRLPRGQRLVKGAYNTAMFVLATAAAGVTMSAVAGASGIPQGSVGLGPWIPATAAALTTYYMTNLLLLAAAIWVTGGAPPTATLPSLLTAGWWGLPLTYGFALAAFVVHIEAGPVALVLLLIPLVSARRALAGVEAQRVSLDRAVRALVRLVEVKDTYTRGHAERVAELSDRVALRMGLGTTERYWIRIGAVLHDVGKIAVPLEVLTKPGELTADEYWQMRRHPDLGADLLAQVDALAPAVHLVRQHHERVDGCGYPRGLPADELPLATRIVSAVDSWDAMTTTRPYRRGLSPEVAVRELLLHSGTQFDADVVEVLVQEVAPELATSPAAAPAPARATSVPVMEAASSVVEAPS